MPSAPNQPTISNLTNSTFTASWNSVTGASYYNLDISTGSNFSNFINEYQNLIVNNTGQLVTGITQDSIYYARVRAINNQTINIVTGNYSQTLPIFTRNEFIIASLPISGEWLTTSYGNNNYIIAGVEQGILGNNYKLAPQKAYSNDGLNWNLITNIPELPSFYSNPIGFVCSAFGNNTFVMFTTSLGSYYSTDGINWLKSNFPNNAFISDVIFANDRFVAVGSNLNCFISFDGIDWVSYPITNVNPGWEKLAFNGSRIVVLAKDSFSSSPSTFDGAYSDNLGITWTGFINSVRGSQIAGLTYGNGYFVFVSRTSNGSMYYGYSTNGINWIENNLHISNDPNAFFEGGLDAILFFNGKFLIYGLRIGSDPRSSIWIAENPSVKTNWVEFKLNIDKDLFNNINDIIFNNNTIIIVGGGSTRNEHINKIIISPSLT